MLERKAMPTWAMRLLDWFLKASAKSQGREGEKGSSEAGQRMVEFIFRH